ncbi:MAG: amidophosphoribosyltransferase [Methanoculleaceae archaeon]
MCGIVGIVDAGGVSYPLYYSLYALQHRGQESAGIATYDNGRVYSYKRNGLVSDVFNRTVLRELTGRSGIGHVRYPASCGNIPENIQPLTFTFGGHTCAIVHEGNLINNVELRRQFEEEGHVFSTTSDAGVIASVIADEFHVSRSVEDAVLRCMRTLRGSYSVILLLDGVIYAFRDPLGIRPLCIGRLADGHMIASESVAVDALAGTFIRDVRPGELVRIDDDGIECRQVAKANHTAHCLFEYVYFSRADSVIDGRLVYDVRREIGAQLYREDPIEADIVSPVPDSGIAHAIGYAQASGIPYLEGLMKNRYMGRTFIMPTQEARELAVRIKLNPIRQHISGKEVVLVDDSIVRGTTSRRIIGIMRDAGAAGVHMRVGSPPIRSPCYLGVDMPTREELIASRRHDESVREQIGATSLHHISLEALIRVIGIPEEDLCTGCITGRYPVCIECEQYDPRSVDFTCGTYQSELEIDG